MPKINLYNIDCMEFMKDKSENEYDLAIVDPPYGIELSMYRPYLKKDRSKEYNDNQINNKKYIQKEWDKKPDKQYFYELFRISKNQIICGGYMFTDILSISKSWILWDKKISNNSTFSPYDMFWTSFTCGIKKIEISPLSETKGGKERIHPTQKPIELYRWLLKNYAKPKDKILDTHGGSMSIAIACHDMGFDLDLCELDKNYYNSAKKRYENHINQLRLF